MSADSILVQLCVHSPEWAAVARRESARLAQVLGENLVEVEHIGSTAIPGIKAKPTIDLLPVVRQLAAVDALADAIRNLGYDWRGEFGLPGRRYCTFNDPNTGERIVNVHIFEQGSPTIDRLLAFRDYVRAHPPEAQAYELEKIRAAAQHPHDSLAYNDAKSDWIKACELRALVWWPGKRK
jgi:GrpB-like predicted nucleotidyltransferase (UPF0157 family)